MTLASLLNAALIIVLLGVVWYILNQLPLPTPVNKIVAILFVLIAVLVVLGAMGFVNMAVPQLLRL